MLGVTVSLAYRDGDRILQWWTSSSVSIVIFSHPSLTKINKHLARIFLETFLMACLAFKWFFLLFTSHLHLFSLTKPCKIQKDCKEFSQTLFSAAVSKVGGVGSQELYEKTCLGF